MNLPVPAMYALTLLWTVMTGAAVVLVAYGLRGRQVDRLGRCRSCGYVIHGGFDPTTCPECGTNIYQRGLRFGRRQLLATPLIFGLMLLAVGLTPIAVMVVQKPKQAVATAMKAPALNMPTTAVNAAPTSGELPSAASNASPNAQAAEQSEAFSAPIQMGLLDQLGTPPSSNEIAPPDSVHAAAFDPGGDEALIRTESDRLPREVSRARTSGSRTSHGALDAAAMGAVAIDWPVDGWLSTWQVKGATTSTGAIYSEVVPTPLADYQLRPSRLGFGPMAQRVEAVGSSAAHAWTPTFASPDKPMRLRAKSTAVKPARANSSKRVR